MQLQVEYVDISTIKPYKGNAKEHPKEQIEQIKKSMQEFGNIDPIGNMMEMSPKYVDVIIKSWEEYTGKKAVKIA